MKGDSNKAVLAALIANFGIAIAKFVGFAFTGAASMLAEAIHSCADTANQGLLFLGGALAKREATPEHPFGFGRERFFWAFVVALVIFTLGSLFAIYEGISKLTHPHDLNSPQWAIGILIAAIALETWSFRTAIREANYIRGSQGWWAFIRTSKVPELPVVLLEDLGALIGLVLALLGIGLALVTGDARFDAMGSIAIGVLLGVIAVVLASETRSLLLGEAATPKMRAAIRAAFDQSPEIKRLIHVRTEHVGPEALMVGAKVELDGALSFPEIAAAVDAVEGRLRAAVPIARFIYIEPDVFKPDDS